jgi:hypothetical protein
MLDLGLDVAETTGWQRCESCGGRNAPAATACEFCARIFRPVRDASAPRHLRRAKWWLPLGLGVLLFSALMVIFFQMLAAR